MTWQVVTPQPMALGESPFWHPGEGMLYWVDIPGRRLLRMRPGAGAPETWAMPSEPGCIAPAERGGLVIALRDGIYRAPAWQGGLRLLQPAAHDTATTRFNDGKADALGRFWASTIYEPRTTAAAALFALDCRDGPVPGLQHMAGDATVGNGLAWSPDNKTLYWSDTKRHLIRAWDWDATGNTMTDERVFQQFAAKPGGWTSAMAGYGGRPDGAAVDVLGNYYAAMFEGQRLVKISPDAQVLAEIPVPAQCPTMPCFGGDDLQTLFVTTARENRPAEELARLPQSGCVFSMRVDVPGLPVNFFRD